MILLKYTPEVAKKYYLKGRTDYKKTTQWLIMHKNNVYAGKLALTPAGKIMEIHLTMLSRSPFTYKRVLRFAERMCIKRGFTAAWVYISFTKEDLKARKQTKGLRQAMLCLANGYSLSNKCMETVFYPRESIEASKWFDRHFKAYKDQHSFVPVEGYTVLPYSQLTQEEIASIKATVKQHFVDYISFVNDFPECATTKSYVVMKDDICAAFITMSLKEPGQYTLEAISSNRDYPRAGLVALSHFAYDLQNEMPDFKAIRADFYHYCNSGRRLVTDVLKLPIASYERRITLSKKLPGHNHSHQQKPISQQELYQKIINIPHTISLDRI